MLSIDEGTDFFDDLLQLLVALAVVGLVLASALADQRLIRTKIASLEAISLATGVRHSVHEYRAATGRWPDAGSELVGLPTGRPFGKTATSARLLEHGTIEVDIVDSGDETYTLTFRPAVMSSAPESPLIWLCGAAHAPSAFVVTSLDIGTMPSALLPSPCRDTHVNAP